MGGDYYDRDVNTTESVQVNAYSNQIQEPEVMTFGTQTEVHSSVKPLRWSEDNLMVEAKNPIVFAIDVTGSMGEWAKIIYNKMPMFYGQIMMQKYLPDPAISFCAIGDHTCDDLPLQVTEFGQGKAIDQLLSKLVLWKSGNGNEHESYELAAYFFNNQVDFMGAEMPFFFITGDEGYFEKIEGTTAQTVFGKGLKQQTIESEGVWRELMQKYNVFHIHKPYSSANYEAKIHQQWVNMLGEERVLDISVPKACVDMILGAIALTAGKTLDQYVDDMKARGQDQTRINEVSKALLKYSVKLAKGEIIPVTMKSNPLDNLNIQQNNSISVNIQPQEGKNTDSDLEEVIKSYEKLLLEELDADDSQLWTRMKELKKNKGETIPKEFICPLTNEIIFDPVMTCDGITFERKAIECWMENHNYSPVTKSKFDAKIVLPNFALKQLIRDYINSA